MITMESVERILSKMPKVGPSQIDRQRLLFDLQRHCEGKYKVLTTGGGMRLTERGLTKLSRFRKKMLDLRNDANTPWLLLGEEITALISKLDAILECQPTPPLKVSPKELLVGQDLPFIFKKHFGSRAARSRDAITGLLRDGAYFTFAQAVLSEMDIKYSNESISRAMTVQGRRRSR